MTLYREPDAKTSEEPLDTRRELLFFGLAILLLAALIYASGSARHTTAIRAEGQNLVRLHIIANSDDPADQAVKLKVRDRILREVGAELGSAADARQALATVRAELGRIEALANDELSKDGHPYGAAAVVGVYDFPDRTYGDLTLPAGRYNALRVVLGEGRGQNWWCVLFPPICLVDLAVDVERPAGSGAALLAEGEGAAAPHELPVEIRWQFLDWLKRTAFGRALASVAGLNRQAEEARP